MKCCNRVCSTPFCPYCGHAASTDPLSELARYVRGRRDQAQRQVSRWEPLEMLNDAQRRTRATDVKSAERWAAWSDALEEHIEGLPSGSDEG